ncbi:hypothetical protein [Kribbella sp. VKM Ac-2568]|uniref:hypothetical protein n=1 Tax=Kribbella sp. VKM Ac-2568 TaxID=2512219 RepID=UPI0010497204|nr:hypothetical protein [Kribbella sp. VKM Ac-2568]TCM35963.1 hypothetical protein EV648_12311 [Kribbella sp. VKM Ac-2568]
MPGGSTTGQGYCNADPVNCSDISGLFTYTITYSLGLFRYSVANFFGYLLRCFTCYFPIPGARALRYNQGMDLRVGPARIWFPLWVSRLWQGTNSAGWRFKTLHGHPDYPGYIEFHFYKSYGWLYLTIHGWVPWYSAGAWVPKPIYVAIARQTWNRFALKPLVSRLRQRWELPAVLSVSQKGRNRET